MVQDVKKLALNTAVQEKGASRETRQTLENLESDVTNIISETTYIFEPSTFAVIDHLERSMLSIMTSQIILESKLAQYASRFRAMSAANDRSKETLSDLQMAFYRAKRAIADERLKEIIVGMKGAAQA
jgi:F-type H+-transporting ATPase subunit gamma